VVDQSPPTADCPLCGLNIQLTARGAFKKHGHGAVSVGVVMGNRLLGLPQMLDARSKPCRSSGMRLADVVATSDEERRRAFRRTHLFDTEETTNAH
jgi:hypothetical protein